MMGEQCAANTMGYASSVEKDITWKLGCSPIETGHRGLCQRCPVGFVLVVRFRRIWFLHQEFH